MSLPQTTTSQPLIADFVTAATPMGGPGDPALYVRHAFELDAAPVRAVLRTTAIGLVEPHLNGQIVGDEVLAPGWTSYRHRLAVRAHDVTALVRPGRNVLAAVVGQGWAVGRLGWENQRHHYADQPAVLVQVDVEFADGTVRSFGTDATSRVGTGGVRAHSLYDGESFDARLERDGWDAVAFDDSDWEAVALGDWPRETLIDSGAEPIRRIEQLRALDVRQTPQGRTVIDFGQNISGRVRIRVSGEAGTTVTLRHAEVLVAGEPDVETLRTAEATDRYTLRGEGVEEWEPRFTFHGFRYVEVEGWPGVPTAEDIVAVVLHSDMARTGWMETSNDLLNRLHSNAVWSMRDNFVGVPTDCPQRDERLGWTGDINAFAPSAAFLYDVRGVLGSWLKDLAAEQSATGTVPWVVPNVLSEPTPPTALWSDVAVNLPWVLYREYGDLGILRDAYGSMTTFVRQVEQLLDADGLWSSGFQFGDWLDPDAPLNNPAGGKTDGHLVAAAYLCRTTRQLADTAALLGEEADAASFGALADRVRRAFRREYITATGRVAGETVTAYALAIVFGLLEPDELAHAGDLLAGRVTAAGFRISTGFAGTPLVTDALTITGHLDEAYLLLTETECPSFLYPVTMGATTIWERWDSVRPDGTINPSGMTSLNHYALGAVIDWMHRTIGGLTAIEPGYRRMRIAPLPGGDLTSARVRHVVPAGEIEVSWTQEGQRMHLDVTIPAGTRAEVVLPRHPEAARHEVGPGTHAWTYGIAASGPTGEFTLLSQLADIARDPAAWERFTAAFAAHMPGVPLDAATAQEARMTVATMLTHIPGASDELRNDLAEALAPGRAVRA